jgi:hypothetical protein
MNAVDLQFVYEKDAIVDNKRGSIGTAKLLGFDGYGAHLIVGRVFHT